MLSGVARLAYIVFLIPLLGTFAFNGNAAMAAQDSPAKSFNKEATEMLLEGLWIFNTKREKGKGGKKEKKDSGKWKGYYIKNVDELKALIEKGADVNASSDKGDTPLMAAVNWGNAEMVQVLLEAGAKVNVFNEVGDSPLVLAARNSGPAIVELLLQNGAGPNLSNKDGNTPLMAAAIRGHGEIMEKLLDGGADVNARNKNGVTPLLYSIYRETGKAGLLIERGADVNIADNEGDTPLIMASGMKSAELVSMLIEKGADVNAANHQGGTPFFTATITANRNIREILLAAGASKKIKAGDGTTYLMALVIGGFPDEVKEEVEKNGAGVNANAMIQGKRMTPVYLAAIKNEDKIVEYLLSKGAKQEEVERAKDLRFCSAVKSDLANAALSQEHYFMDNDTYTTDISSLASFELTEGVSLEIVTADTKLHILKASHPKCDSDGDGAPDVFVWDSSKKGLQP